MDIDIIPYDSEHVFEEEAQYQEVMMRYYCAILEMRTKLEVLSNDLSVRYRRNPIEFIETRLKTPSSIASKLRRLGHSVTVESMRKYLSDIAGIIKNSLSDETDNDKALRNADILYNAMNCKQKVAFSYWD